MARNDERNRGVSDRPERAERSRSERERERSDSERDISISSETRDRSITPRSRDYGISDTDWHPLSMMRRFSEEVDRIFGGRGFGLSRFGGLTTFSPQVEVFERGNKLVVRADLPGLKKEDVQVDVEDDLLTIKGERREEREESRDSYYLSERSFGSFQRTIPLPRGVKTENARADFKDGVLEIEFDAPQHQRGRRIEIGEGSSEQPGRSSR